MKKRRKVLSVMLCAAMIASLAACGSKGDDKKSSDDGGKVKLTFQHLYMLKNHIKKQSMHCLKHTAKKNQM